MRLGKIAAAAAVLCLYEAAQALGRAAVQVLYDAHKRRQRRGDEVRKLRKKFAELAKRLDAHAQAINIVIAEQRAHQAAEAAPTDDDGDAVDE